MPDSETKRPSTPSSKDLLLAAGFDLLAGGVALSAIKLLDLTRAAGVSNGSFYHAWPDGMLAYQRDLAAHAVDLAHSEYLRTIEASVTSVDPTTTSFRDVVMVQCKADAAGIDRDPSFVAELSLWVMHKQHADIREALKSQYGQFAETLYLPMYGWALDEYGLEPREPFDLRTVATMMTALAEGLALRRAVDPDAAALAPEIESEGWDLYGMLTYCLLSVMLRPSKNRDTRSAVQLADDLLRESTPGAAENARAAEAVAFRDDLDGTIAAIEEQLERLKRLRSRHR